MLGPFATASRRTPPVLHCHSPGVATVTRRHCRTLPVHRCPQQHRQRQRVTEGTAVAPWNGPNELLTDGVLEYGPSKSQHELDQRLFPEKFGS